MIFNSYNCPVNLCFNLSPSAILMARYIPVTFSNKDPRCCFGNHMRTSPFSSSSMTTFSFSIFVILNRSWVNLFFSLSPTTIIIAHTPFFSALTVSLSLAVGHFTAAETPNQYKPQVLHKFFGSGYDG
jgi:hypothetical protein